MTMSFDAVRQLARTCASEHLAMTPRIAAEVLSCPEITARHMLNYGCEARYFRFLWNYYLPTGKAAGISGPLLPRFLRSKVHHKTRKRGVLRSFVRFISRPELSYLPVPEQDELIRAYRIPDHGYSRALIGLDGAHSHVFVPILEKESPISTIESACVRWFNLLESGTATLHFVTHSGSHVEGVREALESFKSTDKPNNALQHELAEIETAIAADKYGTASIRYATRLAVLRREIANTTNDKELSSFTWLGDLFVCFYN